MPTDAGEMTAAGSSFPIRRVGWPRLSSLRGIGPLPQCATTTTTAQADTEATLDSAWPCSNDIWAHRVNLSPLTVELLLQPATPARSRTPKVQKGKNSTMSSLATVSASPHCWECRRRRLVCDGAQPVCSKCRDAHIVCPGYADKKPLTWLAPGQVLCRGRRRKGGRKGPGHSTKPTTSPPSSSNGSRDGHHSDEVETIELIDRDAPAPPAPAELRPEVCDVFEALLYCTWPKHSLLFDSLTMSENQTHTTGSC